MDPFSALVLLAAVAAPLAVVSGWFVRGGFGGLGSLVTRGDPDAWWRSSMPWPQGIQEEDGPRWRLDEGDAEEASPAEDGLDVAPIRAHAHLRAGASLRNGSREGR
jgi:hypothetical protein